jgi:hypothetical protein
LLASACADDGNNSANKHPRDPREDDFPGVVGLAAMPLLATACSIASTATATTMTVIVRDGESALISFRPSDGQVTVNGNTNPSTGSSGPCEVGSTGGFINVIGDTGGTRASGRSVILDYLNGLFMTATSATVPGIKVDFSNIPGDSGTLNRLIVRGSDYNDQFAVGAGTGVGTAAAFAFNANAKTTAATTANPGTGGGTVTLDANPDVTLKTVSQVILSAGPGDDRLDAAGGGTMAGVGAAFPNAVRLFGGDGNDVILGGPGADTLSGGAGNDFMQGCAGDDTYDMGAPGGGGADIITQNCVTAPATEGNDTLDYSKRTGNLVVNLVKNIAALGTTGATGDSGWSGEGVSVGTTGTSGEAARISDKFATIRLGAGDDVLNLPANSTIVHRVFGGAGDDTFAGGTVPDTFDGEGGNDTCVGNNVTMSYAARASTGPVTVTTCAGNCTAADANDGEQSTTAVTRSGTAAVTIPPSSGVLTADVPDTNNGFTQASVGTNLTLGNCTTPANDGNYKIVAVTTNGGVAKIDVTAAGPSGDACDFVETRPGIAPHGGTGVSVSVKHNSGSVTGLDHISSLLGYLLTLAATGNTPTVDDGTFHIIGSSGSTVWVDVTSSTVDGTALSGYTGGTSGLTWSASGPERDDVRCAHVIGSSGADLIIGDSRANNFRGGLGADTLIGATGSDYLTGEGGADSLYGGPGDDTLIGGGGPVAASDGVDLLFGGDGNDLMEGDLGGDTFTCDGRNTPAAATGGTGPGEADIKVDFNASSGDQGGTDCEF